MDECISPRAPGKSKKGYVYIQLAFSHRERDLIHQAAVAKGYEDDVLFVQHALYEAYADGKFAT